mgnify:CR=1 FL=1
MLCDNGPGQSSPKREGSGPLSILRILMDFEELIGYIENWMAAKKPVPRSVCARVCLARELRRV